jgi:hypothetical protein
LATFSSASKSISSLVVVEADHQALDVEDDVNDVLEYAGHRRELVLDPLDRGAGHGRALDGGEEDPPEAVAHRGPKAPLKRLHDETSERLGPRAFIQLHLSRQLKPAPSNVHFRCSRTSAAF